ncbi:DUF1015 domain-containing protein [bacterium]|nr:MAG: DUF1015 domain-containing protein [bacterium]
MAVIRPFRALRPKREFAEKIASPPYDIISSEEARKIYEKNPLSFVRVIRPEVNFPPGEGMYAEKVYKKAKEELLRYLKEGHMLQDETPKFYIYQQKDASHTQTGLVCVASCEDYEKDVIKKHELTREEKEIDRAKHIDIVAAQTGPVFLTYRSREDVDPLLEEGKKGEPEYDFESDGVRHTLWVVDDPELISRIRKAFEGIDRLYVADGHHRSAASVRVKNWRKERNPKHTGEEEYNFFLCVVFPHSQLRILDYNRVVRDLNRLTKEEFIEKIKENFRVEPAPSSPYRPEKPHEFGMYLGGKWYKLVAKTIPEDPVGSLDVSILQNFLLSPILGIQDPRRDKRINFVGGIKGLSELERLVNSGEYKVAFSMYPTTMDDLLRVADAGLIMPPKSTWFEPKLKSGLFVHLIEEV